MGSSTKTQKARNAASSVGSNEYVRRLVEDEELRDSIREAYDAGRIASDQLRGRKTKSGGSALGKLLLVAIVGAILAIALSEDIRKAVLDRLFGAEEEFEYTSTTAPTNGGSA